MRRLCFVLCALFLFTPFATAQTSVVAAKKAELHFTSNLTPDQLLTLVKAVAGEVGGGILPKTSGSNCGGFSCDVICVNGRGIDMLGDSDGAAVPQWNDIGPISMSTCQMVPKPGPSEPPPGTPPGDTTIPIGELLKPLLDELAALRAQIAALQVEIVKLREQGITAKIRW